MGRIHRYGQKHDPVVIVNLVAGGTREGRVLKTLLEKLEVIREQLQSDKVFDVVGRLFEEVSMTDYLRQALTDDAEAVARQLEGNLTENQVLALEQKERVLYGEGGDVRQRLPQLNEENRSGKPIANCSPATCAVLWSERRRCSICVSRAIPENHLQLGAQPSPRQRPPALVT